MRTIYKLPIRWLLLVLAMVWGGAVWAQRVSRETAHRVAETFFSQNMRTGQGQAAQFEDVTAETPFQNFYIFRADSSFVLVAADERVTPILGYSKTNRFVTEDMPENLRWWLEGYDEQIRIARENNVAPTQEITLNWYNLKEGRIVYGNRNVVGPLLQMQWGQDEPYSLQCPSVEFSNGLRIYCYTGCNATAMAQVMKYWNHPYSGNGSRKIRRLFYPVQQHPEFYPITVNFNDVVYHWENMRNSKSEMDEEAEIDAVSTLMFHCGVSIGTNYDYELPGSEASAPGIPGALMNFFFYKSTAEFKRRSDYNDDQWVQLLKSELNASRPILYGGHDPDLHGGHEFVCDGYDEEYGNNYFHFNWGYDGNDDGNYCINLLNPLDFNNLSDSQDAIIGIEPDEGSVTVSISPDNCGVVNGAGVYRKGSYCTLEAIPNNGCVFINWTMNNEIISTDPTISLKVTDDIHLEAKFQRNYSVITTLVLPPGSGVTSGDGVYDNGSSCTLTATPNLGYAFKGWYNVWETICYSTQPEYTFTVTQDKTLTAKFIPANYTITLNASPTAGGSISGDGTYPSGSVVTVSAHANSGYRFNGWVENGEVVSMGTSYMFSATADRNLTATFVSISSSIGSVVTNADGSRGVLYHIDPSGVGWMVAMDEASEGCQWGPTTNIQLLPDRTCDNVVALEDLSGFRNTGLIRTELGIENDYAASQVDFDHGWYLPSAGQLRKLYSALPFVDSVLYQHGGSTISEDTYWSSTEYSSSEAATPMFAMSNSSKSSNRRVRAIRNYYSPQDNTILAMPDSPTRGEVMNYHNGVYSYGENAAVVATPKPGYLFDHWSEEGLPVSYNHNYTFTFTHSRRLIAHFVVSGGIGTVVHNADGSDGVVFYMNTEGTEGLMVALEDASEGCQWGTNSNIIPLNDRPLNGVSALEDVSGFHNTGLIRTAQNIDSTVYAAGVVDYENGWYLPAAGELRKLYAALPLIETALVRAGGSTLTEGTYWSSTEYSTSDASTPMFSMGNTAKTSACRVRAIRKFLPSGIHSLVAKSQDTIMGTASGSGTYDYNATVTVSAVANEGFVFESWTEDGMVVSYDATYQFLFTRNCVLVANFRVAGTVGEIVHNADGSTGVVFYQNAEGTEGWMVALEDASEGCQWGPTANINAMPDMPYNDVRVMEDVSGYRNTDLIRKVLGTNNDYAASVVDFDNGWYLPAAGQLRKLYAALPMIEESILNAGGTLLTEDAYWSSSEYNTSDAFSPLFAMSNVSKTSSRRVRAIRTFNCTNTNVVRVMANNVAFGSVAGGGNYEIGASVSVLATPKPNYAFDHWEEDGCTVSYDRYFTFEFTRTRTLVAVFVRENSIGSIVHNADGSKGVIFYTYPSGIGGLMVALEDVSEGCPWGLNEDITIMDNQSPSAVMDLLNDMCGKSNTNRVRQWYSDNPEYAACKTDYANGWYLPSAGQLRKLYAALPLIEAAIVNAGGTTLTEDAYWSSTEQSASNAWTPSFAMSSSSKTGNCRVRAIRSLTDTETITANVNIEGGGLVTGAGWYDHGQTCTLKAQANESYAFLNWTHGGTVVSTKMEYSFTVLGNQTYTANFVANSSNITTAIEPANSGTVTGAGIYTIGSNCTLTATPHTGYSFVNWKKNGNVVSTNPSYSFTVAESAQYTAHFVINSYAVNATAFPEEGGTVSGAHAYTHGSTATLTATAAEGYTFVNWTENGAVISTSPTLQIGVYGNRTLVANFSDNAYTVTTITYPSNGGTIEGGGVYIHGTTATLTAYANPQFEFFCWFDGDDMVSFEPTISFEVTEDVVFYAVFVENEDIIQTVNLSEGWNWVSFNVEITLDNLKAALVEAMPSTVIIIKSQTQITSYNPNNHRWNGQLTSLDLSKMYMIKVVSGCGFTLYGDLIDPTEHPVTINFGNNWIGFPLDASMSLTNTFAGFAANGDKIRSQTGNSQYIHNRWMGQGLTDLEPGKGYIYNSDIQSNRVIVFPAPAK